MPQESVQQLEWLKKLALQVILPEQQLLESPETWAGVLAHIPDPNTRHTLHSSWSNNSRKRDSSDLNVARWNELVTQVDKVQQV